MAFIIRVKELQRRVIASQGIATDKIEAVAIGRRLGISGSESTTI